MKYNFLFYFCVTAVELGGRASRDGLDTSRIIILEADDDNNTNNQLDGNETDSSVSSGYNIFGAPDTTCDNSEGWYSESSSAAMESSSELPEGAAAAVEVDLKSESDDMDHTMSETNMSWNEGPSTVSTFSRGYSSVYERDAGERQRQTVEVCLFIMQIRF